MRGSACGIGETSFRRGHTPSGEIVYLCPACFEREDRTLEPTGDGCGCMPAPLRLG